MKNPNGPKILTLDIETAPLESYHWGLFDQNIGLDQIAIEWTILSYAAKWLDEDKVIYKSTGGKGAAKVRDDSELLKGLWGLLDQADIIIAQNGVQFDIKKINARLLMKGFGPYSPVKVIDTLQIAKKHFGFTSNKLAWMSEHLTKTKKSEHKQFPGFELWEECLKDNPKAWKEMELYNCKDVLSTEELYLKLRPWMENHPNIANYNPLEKMLCPKCGSDKVQKRGKALTQTGEYHRFQCGACGGWSRSRYTLNTKNKRTTLLSN